jgi:hypothetical protein
MHTTGCSADGNGRTAHSLVLYRRVTHDSHAHISRSPLLGFIDRVEWIGAVSVFCRAATGRVNSQI